MPINYQPPSPVSPYTSAAYGAAEEFNKVAPLIQQARAQQLQAGIAGAQAYNQGGEQVTQRTIAAGQQNTQLEALHQSQLFQANQQQAEYAQQQQMQYAQQEQAAAQQRKHYEDTVNASYQQMTQAENIRLQRLREADSWIDEQHLEPDMAASMHAQVRGMRGPLEYKAEMAQTKIAEAHAKLFTQDADLKHQQALKLAKIETMTMDERTKHTYDPAVVAQVESDLGPRPEGGGPAGVIAQQLYDATRKRLIEADTNGIMATHILQSDGKLIEVKRPNAHADRQAQDVEAAKRHWQSVYNEQSKEVETAINRDAKAGVTNRENWTAEGKNEAIRNRMQVAVGAPSLEAYLGNVLGGKARPPHVPGAKFAALGGEGQAPPPQQPDRVAQPTEAPRAKPFVLTDPKTQDIGQEKQVKDFDRTASTISERDDLSPDVKQAAVYQIEWAKKKLAERGSFEAFTDDEKRQALQMRKWLDTILSTPEPARPQPQPKPAPPPPNWLQRNTPDLTTTQGMRQLRIQ